ncbi:transcriptional regulator [Nostoc sp. UHCC 0251]|uniref:helix-turn-helix domain-containing protein n=1 Tax=Nostoc sp. UHCC 0251 TaxID=3110240 RepID=UPI002B1F75D7|nr:transcriptional regulator [Nostoc sp. UHCC 0251]MEA5626426.1 transcriptional regulator [Nostoc sp. UHCC 0251]
MTLTFNSDIYSQLLSQHQPRIIKTEEENEKFLETVEELLSHSHLTPEEDALLELLVKLIEDFEDKHYQLNYSTPFSRLLHLMEARSLEQADLVEILGSSEIVAKIMNGELEITKKQAEALGKFFHVESNLFIC